MNLKIEQINIDLDELEHMERVTISDVMIAMNETWRRPWDYCDARSMILAIVVLDDAIKRGVLWGQPRNAYFIKKAKPPELPPLAALIDPGLPTIPMAAPDSVTNR